MRPLLFAVRNAISALAAFGLLLTAAAARADESAARFDGVWTTVVSCAASAGALPYSYEFASTVTNGVLHGERGIKGAPGWLELDGRISPDGSADLSAHGLVGREPAAIEHRPRGTPYKYRVDAKFSENSGTGHRVAGRTCEVSFSKKVP
jgi:hypothetical protein